MRLKAVRELRDAGLTVGDVRAFAHLLRTVPTDGVPDLLAGESGAGRCSAAEAETVARRRPPTWTPVSRSCRACGRDSRHAWANRAPR